ncbi:MAG TPA: ATP-binding cassette domain-containing protein [Stellaceae bacterium]|nr:ATP-binding cassette domain-containing protein [Stellaceae bacterium]
MSGGQQQRVAIARALVQEPDLLLADEPVASLDPHNTRLVMDALRQINRDFGIMVLCNLHAVELAQECCDRLIGMSAGKIVFDGAPAGLTEAITDGFTAAGPATSPDDSNLTRMDKKGMANKDDFRIVFKSDRLPGPPYAYLSSLPDDLKRRIEKTFAEAPQQGRLRPPVRRQGPGFRPGHARGLRRHYRDDEVDRRDAQEKGLTGSARPPTRSFHSRPS